MSGARRRIESERAAARADPSAASPEIVLDVQGVHHWFGSKRVLHDVNLTIARGQIVSLVGPSGCGKSTLLRAIVGTHSPRQGRILVHRTGETIGRVVEGPGRDRGIVYQQYSLFPFLTARENVAIGPMFDQTSLPFRFFRYPAWRRLRRRHLQAAEELLGKLKLGDALKLYPHQMSGGMCQRVAIAQALIMRPAILLLDEPFGALDEATREELQRLLLTLYLENCAARRAGEPPPHTIMIVTHELNEAIYVGDRVAGLSQFWNWQELGFEDCPGATIVYDKMAPIYDPDEEKDSEDFAKHRDEIRRSAFDPKILQAREISIRFWKEVETGAGRGVLAPRERTESQELDSARRL